MSYVFAIPAALAAAATDIAGIGSAVGAANAAAAAATTGVLAAGADEVSVAIAGLFSADAEEYQALSARVAAFHTRFVHTLTVGAESFAGAEAANASRLQSIARQAPGAVGAATDQLPGNGGSNGIAATYAVASQWDSGYVANYTITNSGTAPMTDLAAAIHSA
ncbi:PE domain-containing protein [Mycobacterium shinjukuense]|uniref:PE domain-containing protein n=1 Tax=Mycobacterium shinjukuense TaxID=398694 RepID=UPI0015D45678|nr:PE domain-containing protein [Mycobacterium shinjukuense]MCV6985177.1 PE domain-containing protein [Mycobacterium shinjukuense]